MQIEITDSFGPPQPESIRKFSEHIGYELPIEYSSFLERFNGGHVNLEFFPIKPLPETNEDVGTFGMLGFLFGFDAENYATDLNENWAAWKDRIPSETVPIGVDPGGSLILIGVTGPYLGNILFWHREYEVDFEGGVKPDFSNVGFIASNFVEFFKSLRATY